MSTLAKNHVTIYCAWANRYQKMMVRTCGHMDVITTNMKQPSKCGGKVGTDYQ